MIKTRVCAFQEYIILYFSKKKKKKLVIRAECLFEISFAEMLLPRQFALLNSRGREFVRNGGEVVFREWADVV